MTNVPHLFVVATLETGGRVARGASADVLPPKWFTKDPDTSYEQDDLPSMQSVIRQAADFGRQVGHQSCFFDWWKQLYDAQHAWACQQDIAQLLAGFGVSLIERAVLDAICRSVELPLFQAFHTNVLGIDFSAIRPALGALRPRDVLPKTPNHRVLLRHTIGLGDPLTDSALAESDRPQDGLPLTLEENIRAYGLQYFKIKLSGDLDADRLRLTEIASIVDHHVGTRARITLDGNENFQTIAQFREAWSRLREPKQLRDFFDRSLLFVEQPVHRFSTLDKLAGEELHAWPDAPSIIIDESDADLTSLPRAIALGYSGTSHKNCKGIIKSLLGAATVAHHRQHAKPLILSAEDLVNVGPVALLQDLAMVACLGISHVERNGHQYFAGLSMFPDEIQQSMLDGHPDLVERGWDGTTALAPHGGMLSLRSVNEAPFGLKPFPNWTLFDPWRL